MNDQTDVAVPSSDAPVKTGKKRGRKPGKEKVARAPRSNPILDAFGERGRVASLALPKADRKLLVKALKSQGDTEKLEKLEARINTLVDKAEAIRSASKTVEAYKVKLQRISDLISGTDEKAV